jgi:hypothetical protein
MADTFLKRLSNSSSLTDVLVQMEDFLDSLDLYVFKNWFEGEIVDGPNVSRYWVSMTLKYDYKDMPDPSGGLRLLKHGAKVKFRKGEEEDTETKSSLDQSELQRILAVQNQPAQPFGPDNTFGDPNYPDQLPMKKIWLIDIEIPRQFIEDLDDDDLDLYDKEIEDEATPFKSNAYDDKPEDESDQTAPDQDQGNQ